MNHKALAALAAASFAGLAGAQATATQGVTKDEIVLGTIQDLSGPASAFGKQADQKKTEIDRWAATTLPTIRMHLDHAKQLESQQVSANQ